MKRKRIVYSNGLVAGAVDLSTRTTEWGERESVDGGGGEGARRRRVQEAVRWAIKELPEEDQEFVWRYHFMGESYAEIATGMGCRIGRVAWWHRRSTRILRHLLGPFVYGEDWEKPDCLICRSSRCTEIERVIRGKGREETWRPVLRKLRTEFGLPIRSPWVVLTHLKYHRRLPERLMGRGE